jgi:parallel beta-helix repeat protein
MVITHSVKFRPGIYTMRGEEPGITITAHHAKINLTGVRLRGIKGSVGILLKDCSQVQIVNADVSGFTVDIELVHCRHVVLKQCRALNSADPGPGTVIDESGAQPQDTSGAGFLARSSSHVELSGCTAMYAWDGLDLVNSDHCSAQTCNFSYNENWGVHLWHSSANSVSRCTAIWCTTGRGRLYQALTGWQTYDADAVLIEHGSDHNTISQNDLRFGGDGIFIRSNEAPLKPGTAVPHVFSSDFNRLLNNDCSYSPNNAIEVDFVKGTLIQGNNCSLSNYGMWLGYSRYSKVVGNLCAWDTVRSIEIENGQHGTITGNILADEGPTSNKVLMFLRQNGRDATPSGPYLITNNLFLGGSTAVALIKTPVTLENNIRAANNTTDALPTLVRADGQSVTTITGDLIQAAKPLSTSATVSRVSNTTWSVKGNYTLPALPIAMVTWFGRPLLATRAKGSMLQFTLEPQPSLTGWQPSSAFQVFTNQGWSASTIVTAPAPAGQSLITAVQPVKLTVGGTFTLLGHFTGTGAVTVNGLKAGEASGQCSAIVCRLPSIAPTSKVNLLFQPVRGLPAGPVVVTVLPK